MLIDALAQSAIIKVLIRNAKGIGTSRLDFVHRHQSIRDSRCMKDVSLALSLACLSRSNLYPMVRHPLDKSNEFFLADVVVEHPVKNKRHRKKLMINGMNKMAVRRAVVFLVSGMIQYSFVPANSAEEACLQIKYSLGVFMCDFYRLDIVRVSQVWRFRQRQLLIGVANVCSKQGDPGIH